MKAFGEAVATLTGCDRLDRIQVLLSDPTVDPLERPRPEKRHRGVRSVEVTRGSGARGSGTWGSGLGDSGFGTGD